MIILFGDHGSRNDDVRNTMQGKLEERLPWLSISVPDWLIRKFPHIGLALEHNQHIITSPFDMHATLRHILTYPKEPHGEKTQSLLTQLPHTRTCSDAGKKEFTVKTKFRCFWLLRFLLYWMPFVEFSRAGKSACPENLTFSTYSFD